MSPCLRRLAVVVKGWPRLSETFIAQELVALEARGHAFEIWSLRHPTDRKRHPLHDRLAAPVRYLPEYLHQEPCRVWAGLRTAAGLPGFGAACAVWLRDLRRDRSRNRVRRFGQACVLAANCRTTPALLCPFPAHALLGGPLRRDHARPALGVSAHAKDIWTSPDWEKPKTRSGQPRRALRRDLHRLRRRAPARAGRPRATWT
jgi:colanic acid/amylovoran biosynthesis glycosyltransferase